MNQSCCSTIYVCELNIHEVLSDKFLLKSILCARHICATLHPMGEFALDNVNLHRLEMRSFELFNMLYINYSFSHFDFFHDLRNSNKWSSFELFNMLYINYSFSHFDFFHDLRNSNKCNFKQLIFFMM